ncbi:MAG: CPBP family intramembrane glutamic endopeptidase [Pseudomonadota bacterium]
MVDGNATPQLDPNVFPSSGFAAGGTVHRSAEDAGVGLARRLRLIGEIGVLFIGAPIAMTYAIYGWRVPLFAALLPVMVGIILYLLWDNRFSIRRELAVPMRWRTFLAIIALFIPAGAAITAFAWIDVPERFLAFPRYAFQLWLTIMLLYPFLSALVQEAIYRSFFFHRYGGLFGDHKALAIITNGLLFGFAHIMFASWVTFTISALGGILFAYRYMQTRSLLAVWFEHAIYGNLIFTVGLGRYFFTGVSNAG